MPQDKILLHGLVFYGYHGVIPAEQELGQKFEVDVELSLDFSAAAQSDDLRQTVDYTRVYSDVKQIVEEKKYKLLETLAEDIAQTILGNPSIDQVQVRVRKPHVSTKGPVDYLGVEIVRQRKTNGDSRD